MIRSPENSESLGIQGLSVKAPCLGPGLVSDGSSASRSTQARPVIVGFLHPGISGVACGTVIEPFLDMPTSKRKTWQLRFLFEWAR